MSAPRWARALLQWAAPPDETDDILGDLEETHCKRVADRGRAMAHLLLVADTLDMAVALLQARRRRHGDDTPQRGRPGPPSSHIAARSRRGPVLSWLDLRLAARMLRKYPGLTLVGGLGMAVAIAISAGFFNVFAIFLSQHVTLDEGDRLVGLTAWDVRANAVVQTTAHDYVIWRGGLESLEDLGAYVPFQRNLMPPSGGPQAVDGAEMTASGFRTARVPPLLGRPLLPEDERAGAPLVIVLSYRVWKDRFASDPAVVGQQASLGAGTYTVVGVMPQGFRFPASQSVWTPLRVDSLSGAAGPGRGVSIFGRLAPDATRARAQAELSTLWERTPASDMAGTEQPDRRVGLKPRIIPYPQLFFGTMDAGDQWSMFLLQVMMTLILLVVGANVAILVYARTATRQAEIAVRSALGASRRRIVGQLFAEALVLASVSAAGGLLIAQRVMVYCHSVLEQLEGANIPFWLSDFDIRPVTVAFVLGLTVVAAFIVGVLPGLQATGRRAPQRLSELTGATGMRLGRTWTALIVTQVAATVALLPAAVLQAAVSVQEARAEVGFPADEYLNASILKPADVPTEAAVQLSRQSGHNDAATPAGPAFGAHLRELERRLEAEPNISGVTFAAGMPGKAYGATIEVDGLPPSVDSTQGTSVLSAQVAPDYFDVFGVHPLGGRDFVPEDTASTSAAVLVNQSFVRDVLHGASPLGRRIRSVQMNPDAPPDPWSDIVGVVPDFPPHALDPDAPRAAVFRAQAPERIGGSGLTLMAHVRGTTPANVAGRFREIAFSVDPTLRAIYVMPLDRLYHEGEPQLMRLQALGIALLTLSVILLSGAGIYALMSFTVTRRRREIGIRTALGADRRRILGGIFSRALTQLAVGGVLGVGGAVLLDRIMAGTLLRGHAMLLISGTVAFMLTVGLLSALEPARRGLRVEPTEALRSE